MSNENLLSKAELIRAQAWLGLSSEQCHPQEELLPVLVSTGANGNFSLRGPGPQARTDLCLFRVIVLLNALA
jgi:hypothetical protein